MLIYGSSTEEPDNEEWDLEELGNEERGNEEWDIQMFDEGGEGEWEGGEGDEGDEGDVELLLELLPLSRDIYRADLKSNFKFD